MNNEQRHLIAIPVHRDELDVPVSIVHIPLSNGRYATITGPLAPKTIGALLGSITACRDILVHEEPKKELEFEI